MLLLDTCSLFWLASQRQQLSREAKRQISAASDSLLVSAISAYEIGLKAASAKLEIPTSIEIWFPDVLQRYGIQAIDVSPEIAGAAAMMVSAHRDPFDRIIAATAKLHQSAILSPDSHFILFEGIHTIW